MSRHAEIHTGMQTYKHTGMETYGQTDDRMNEFARIRAQVYTHTPKNAFFRAHTHPVAEPRTREYGCLPMHLGGFLYVGVPLYESVCLRIYPSASMCIDLY